MKCERHLNAHLPLWRCRLILISEPCVSLTVTARVHVQPFEPSLWSYMYAGSVAASPAVLHAARRELQRWPLECVDWPFRNSDRLDILHDPESDRDGAHSMGLRPLPPGTIA